MWKTLCVNRAKCVTPSYPTVQVCNIATWFRPSTHPPPGGMGLKFENWNYACLQQSNIIRPPSTISFFFVGPRSILWSHWLPLFWTLRDPFHGLQSQGGSLTCTLTCLHAVNLWSHLVLPVGENVCSWTDTNRLLWYFWTHVYVHMYTLKSFSI